MKTKVEALNLLAPMFKGYVGFRCGNTSTPICGLCGRTSECKWNAPEGCTKFKPTSFQEAVRTVFLEAATMYDNCELGNMVELFVNEFNGALYDIYAYGLSHDVCDHCNGTGAIITELRPYTCKACGGTGVKEFVGEALTKRLENFNIVYLEFYRDPVTHTFNQVRFHKTVESAQASCNYHEKNFPNQWIRDYGSVIISKRLVDAYLGEYWDSIGNPDRTQTGYRDRCTSEHLIMVDTTWYGWEHRIQKIGHWGELHKSTYIPCMDSYMDIEYMSNGKFVVMTVDEFNDTYH